MKLLNKSLLLIFLMLGSLALAQKNYSGSFALTDSLSGFAKFDYEGREDKPVFVGDFLFEFAKKTDSLVESLIYEGRFNNNKKDGEWIFSRKNLISGDTIKVEGYRISYPASGFEHKVESIFNEGKAEGKWLIIEQILKNGEPTDTLFSSEVNFKDAFMHNELIAKSKDLALNAYFDENGQADSRWVIQHLIDGRKIDEIRVFENGVFVEHLFRFDDKEYKLDHKGLDTTVDDEEDNWVTIDIKDAYFDIFELSNFGFESDLDISELRNIKEITSKTNDFLEKSIVSFAYYKGDPIWSHITDGDKIEFGKFKVRKFKYSKEEKEDLKRIAENNSLILDYIDGFFNNSQVDIGRLTFESLNKYQRIFQIYKERYEELDEISNRITNPALEYLERDKFLKNFVPTFNFPKEISYEFDDKEYKEGHSFPEIPTSENFTIHNVFKFYKFIKEDLSSITDEVENTLNDLEKQEELNEMEEELIKQKNNIQYLFSTDNQQEDYNSHHKDLIQEAQSLVEEEFKNYVNTPLDEKKDAIDSYLECFEQVLSTYDYLIDLERKIQRLDDEYTRVSFNPHIMVDMEERVKERLYNAYEKSVLPYLLKSLQDNFNCDALEDKTDNLEALYQKMIELRERDTQSIERRLRRVKDAEEVLSILEIDIK